MDPASKMSTENMINSLLCECAWGMQDEKQQTWTLVGDCPSVVAPKSGLVTYSDFLEYGKYRYITPTGTKEQKAAALARNKKIKKRKKSLKKSFTFEGQPGEKFKIFAERLKAHLRIPEHLKKRCKESNITQLHGGNLFILPSFFYMMRKLKEQKRKFSIVFRTFGLDGKEVASEFNAFCEGKHPLYPGVHFDGSNGSSDLRVEVPANFGAIKRDTKGNKVTLFKGSLDVDKTPPAQKIENFQNIYDHVVVHATRKGTSLAFRDDYPAWAACAESETSGKLLVVRQHEEDGTRHIFFDDNIERDIAHIVDCRRYDGSAVPFSESKNRWLSKAEPWLSITKPDYFIDCVNICEAGIEEWQARHKK